MTVATAIVNVWTNDATTVAGSYQRRPCCENPNAVLPVAIALVLLEQVVLNVVGPRLMGRQLGLPPLLVLFGILAGGQIGGFWGARYSAFRFWRPCRCAASTFVHAGLPEFVLR
jgi:hypothetical protein